MVRPRSRRQFIGVTTRGPHQLSTSVASSGERTRSRPELEAGVREDGDVEIMDALLRAQEAAAPDVGRGTLAEYIPSLAAVDPHQFGMAVASCDGQVHVV